MKAVDKASPIIVQTATQTTTTGQDSSFACAPVTSATASPP